MNSSNLTTVTRIIKGKRVETVNLSFNKWVTLKYILFLLAAIKRNWPDIDWSSKRTAGDILGIVLWGRINKKKHPTIGRCICHMAKLNLLPQRLELARKRNGQPYKSNNRSYVLAGTQIVAVAPVITARPVKRAGSIDPRTIKVYPAMHLSAP
jgi:hypothetical protein